MSESKQKTTNKHYNRDVVDALQEKYGVSNYFIRASLRGDRTSLTSDKIKKDYKAMTEATMKVVEEIKNK